MGGSIRRSRAILRAALSTLRRSPRLAWFPVLSGLGLLGLMLTGALVVGLGSLLASEPVGQLGPMWSVLADPDPGADETMWRSVSIGLVLAYVGGHVLTIFIGVAMTHAALEALAGRPWTVRESLRLAMRRRRAVVTFAVVEAIVGHLLRARRRGRDGKRRKPGLLHRLAGFAWWAATYLVLPVIAREDRGGLRAIERSAKLWRETWKETLLARLTLGWVWAPAIIIAVVPSVLGAALGVRDPAVLAVLVVVPLFGLFVLGLLLRTLEGIYRAALYTYASEGVVPDAFADGSLCEIWEVRDGPVPADVVDSTAWPDDDVDDDA